ncbi:MAG TPA: glycine cleavage T C-terminal barrel domain-containing protein [Candidatus Eisenbacteria bacterium]|nr:glycine cleavage T C-terminal barrel domain-containing protein [Candidatus Eisenbacteria bacterium]
MAETALHAHLAARGAVHADDRGVVLPRHFGDPEGEYAALRRGAAAVDVGFRTVVRATGPDRATFLQGMLTNDVAHLASGSGCPALLLTIQGRVTADLRVAATDDALLLDVDVRACDAMIAALGKLIIADDVDLEPCADLALVGVEGPTAASVLGATALAPFAHVETTIGGARVRVLHTGEVGGFTVHAPVADAARVWDALVSAGARPCGMDALEGRRVELGVPRVGLDMGESTLALEVPVESAISQTKGCYLGQEVIARGTARGHVNRRLVGLLLDGPAPPPGAPLVRDAKEVGHLTTVATAFGAGKLAALGFVRREAWDPGTEIAVRHGHAVTIARVATWPLS